MPAVSRTPSRKSRDRAYRKKYGISLARYEAMNHAQGGLCLLCGFPCRRGRLCVDHCHQTGRVRGLVCKKCNLRLSALEDSAWRQRAEVYLAR